MATELLYATAHLAGDFPTFNAAIGNTPGTWAGVLNQNSNYTSRWAIGNPVDPLTPAATQTVRVVARKGSNSGHPTITLNLWENGVLVQEIRAATSIVSQTGQVLAGTFVSSAITNPANVEIEVIQVGAGGNPSTRNSAQISHIEWTADTTAAAPPPSEGSFTITDAVSAGWHGQRTSDATFAAGDVAVVAWGGQRAVSAVFAVDDTSTVQWGGDAPSSDPGEGGFAVADVATVEWGGAHDSAGGFTIGDPTLAGWSGNRAAAAEFDVAEAGAIEWSGTRTSGATFDIGDAASVGWSGLAPVLPGAGGGFTVPDVTAIGWSGGRESTAGFDVDDATSTGWAGSTPPVDESGGGYEVPDVATISWVGAHDTGGVYAIGDVVTVTWSNEPEGMIVIEVLGRYEPISEAIGMYREVE